MATHSSILAWRVPGTAELENIWSQKVRHDWATNTFFTKINLKRNAFSPFIHTYSIYSSKHWKCASLPRSLHLARRARPSCADVHVTAKLHFLDPSVSLLESVPMFTPRWGQINWNISIGAEKVSFQGHAKTQDRWTCSKKLQAPQRVSSKAFLKARWGGRGITGYAVNCTQFSDWLMGR